MQRKPLEAVWKLKLFSSTIIYEPFGVKIASWPRLPGAKATRLKSPSPVNGAKTGLRSVNFAKMSLIYEAWV